MPGGHILVVDDDNVLRASIARILEEEGYTVDDAADGATALDKVRQDRPDAILLDVMMPGMNGRQFLDELRQHVDRPVPVVIMTALQGMGLERMISLGANDLVEKPFDVDELLNKVALALFRSGEYDTLADRPGSRAKGTSPPPANEREGGRVVLIVHRDRTLLGAIDSALSNRDHTVVSLTRATDELPRLARALEPDAIVLDLTTTDELLILRRLRAQNALDSVPILVVGDDDFMARHSDTIASMHAAACQGTHEAERLLELLDNLPAGARTPAAE